MAWPVDGDAGLARELGFPLHGGAGAARCCHPDVGRLLGLLAARSARTGEIGTGAGYGTAWMVSAMPRAARLVTIEIDARRAQAAAGLFAHDGRVNVINGDASVWSVEVVAPDLRSSALVATRVQ